MKLALAGAASLFLLAACQSDNATTASSSPSGERAPSHWDYESGPRKAAEPAQAATPARRADAPPVSANELAFPTGDRATSALLLRQRAPQTVLAGSTYDLAFDVINLTHGTLQSVVVTARNLQNLRYVSSDPAFTRSGADDAMWAIGDLAPGATKTINIKAKADKVGVATNCLAVSYANVLCVATNVAQPALQLAKTATPELCGTCGEIVLAYEVKNTGSGTAENVVVKDTLPAGLTVNGKNEVEFNAGTLASGQTKPFQVRAKASAAGEFKSAATATSTGGLTAQSGAPVTVVKQPALAVTCEAPGRVFVGRDISFKFTVKNPGTCPAADAVVTAPVPTGTTFVSADAGGSASGGRVRWNLGSLLAGESKTLTMRVKPTGMGSAAVTPTAVATCVQAVTSNCATDVAGIPAILLEVVDTDDPVEVGGTTTFIVTVTNQGSAADRNVKVIGKLPAGMEFVSGTGASAATAAGGVVTMAAVPSLAAKARAEWRIVVRCKVEGATRSKWSLTSEQFGAAIEETVSTNIYK